MRVSGFISDDTFPLDSDFWPAQLLPVIDLSRWRDGLPLRIECNPDNGFPLLREAPAILELILSYLALPYSVSEYGCGKRASMILAYLFDLGIPPYALARGMAMEADMSLGALAELDWRRRRHSMVVPNPLSERADLNDPLLRRVLLDNCPGLWIEEDSIRIDEYILRHRPLVQFAVARSHIYPLLRLWDDEHSKVVVRVIDPTLHSGDLFALSEIRHLLSAPEALLFEAPLLGNFWLDSDTLTEKQQLTIAAHLGVERDDIEQSLLDLLAFDEHAELVRTICGAEVGSIADPATWTYANNIAGDEGLHHQRQLANTGIGERFRPLVRQLEESHLEGDEEVARVRRDLSVPIEESDVRRILQEDAAWSRNKLEPLAKVAVAISYYRTLLTIERSIRDGESLEEWLGNPENELEVRGLAVRMRRRIDRLADLSRDSEGRIDARLFNGGLNGAVCEVARQMSRAGLLTMIDTAGNCHGLHLSETKRLDLLEGRTTLPELIEGRLCFGSAIDTEFDAAPFAGRLGIASGIEIANLLHDLRRYFGLDAGSLMVSAFIEDRATICSEKDTLAGSGLVAGLIDEESLYAKRDHLGRSYREALGVLLRSLQLEQREERIELLNRFDLIDGDRDLQLLECCFPARDFFTPWFYERQVEAAAVPESPLVADGLPMLLIGRFESEIGCIDLRESSAALLIERSFRGGRNRYTIQILSDMIHGTLLQLLVTLRFHSENEHKRQDPSMVKKRLYRVISELIPNEWVGSSTWCERALLSSAGSIAQGQHLDKPPHSR